MDNYVSVAQYAKLKGVTVQAIYKQIRKGTFTPDVVELEGKKYVILEKGSEQYNEPDTEPKHETPETSSEIFDLLTQQLNQNNETIKTLLAQVSAQQKTIDALTGQINRLTDLVEHQQTLTLLGQPALLTAEEEKTPAQMDCNEPERDIVQPEEMQSNQSRQNPSVWERWKRFWM